MASVERQMAPVVSKTSSNRPSSLAITTAEPGWSLGFRITSPDDIIGKIESGFPMNAVETLQEYLDVTDDDVAQVIGISARTLIRRRKDGRLETEESDRLYRLAMLFECAVDVFGDDVEAIQGAKDWFHGPQWGLGGRIPLVLAQTEPGSREVEKLLLRIDYGVLV